METKNSLNNRETKTNSSFKIDSFCIKCGTIVEHEFEVLDKAKKIGKRMIFSVREKCLTCKLKRTLFRKQDEIYRFEHLAKLKNHLKS